MRRVERNSPDEDSRQQRRRFWLFVSTLIVLALWLALSALAVWFLLRV